jgi:hypothetical protein
MTSDSIVDVAEAQSRLDNLIKQDSFAISRNGKIVGVYLSKKRIEALAEVMDLSGNSEFAEALKQYESGQMKFYEVGQLDREMSREY